MLLWFLIQRNLFAQINYSSLRSYKYSRLLIRDKTSIILSLNHKNDDDNNNVICNKSMIEEIRKSNARN